MAIDDVRLLANSVWLRSRPTSGRSCWTSPMNRGCGRDPQAYLRSITRRPRRRVTSHGGRRGSIRDMPRRSRRRTRAEHRVAAWTWRSQSLDTTHASCRDRARGLSIPTSRRRHASLQTRSQPHGPATCQGQPGLQVGSPRRGGRWHEVPPAALRASQARTSRLDETLRSAATRTGLGVVSMMRSSSSFDAPASNRSARSRASLISHRIPPRNSPPTASR